MTAAILGQISLSNLAGHVEELFTAEGDTSVPVCGCDIKDNATQDVNPCVTGSVDVGADSEQVRLLIA